jgi:hypothetical protein
MQKAKAIWLMKWFYIRDWTKSRSTMQKAKAIWLMKWFYIRDWTKSRSYHNTKWSRKYHVLLLIYLSN